MNINIEQNKQNVNITITGRVDTITAPELEAAIEQLMSQNGLAIRVDCTEMSYVSSSGLRVFLKLLKSTTANSGTLSIENLSAEIREVFDITGFSSLFNLE